MNVVDVIVLVPVLWGAYKGYKNGLISEGGTVIALIVGIWAAVSFSDNLGGVIGDMFSITSTYKEVVAFSLIFLCVVILSFIVTKILTNLFEAIKLGWLNSILGILFGMLKYLIVFSFLFFFARTMVERYYEKKVEVFEESLFFNPLANSAHSLLEGSIKMPEIKVASLK